MKSLSHVWLLVTPWTEAHQAPPSMGFSRQEYWSAVGNSLWECKLLQSLWKTAWRSLKILKNRATIKSNNPPPPEYISKRNKNRISKRYLHYLHSCVYWSTTHNSQDIENNQNAHQQMNGQRYIHDIDMMGYYSALKKRKKKKERKEILHLWQHRWT